MEIDLENGDRARLMNIICYESIFPGLVARFVQEGAEFLTLVTNDGWYATSYGPYQHAAIARLRCIENRRSMVRCANTGVSQFIDMAGRVYADLPWWQARTLTADVDCNSELTFYTRYPLLVPLLSLSVATGLFLFSLFSRRRRRRENRIPES
ncbi:nitrilase-related carbon-nitrogen hydrolase [Prosthecochloris sp. HL-130-GSB]|uniref:nitrilase-related carbon-nitrogen hydrolase n=1 Tax=Prosthecochloris sp. HL-130-GSB TaxID=1974213 RepID=UPI003518EDC8